MVERKKTEKDGKSKTRDADTTSDLSSGSGSGSLAASLDALRSIADSAEKAGEAEVVQLNSRKEEDKPSKMEQELNVSEVEKTVDPEIKRGETAGIVELLSALKSDIDSLRQDNEEFKAQLIGSTKGGRKKNRQGEDDSAEVRELLQALQADIGNLRHENDLLRSQAFAAQDKKLIIADKSQDDELYLMLAELKQDIVSLRTENDALRREHIPEQPASPVEKTSEVALMLQELKADINDLKHENEALRLDNLTARDAARLENMTAQQGDYRNSGNSLFSRFLKELGALVLIAGAAGGIYYVANWQGWLTFLTQPPSEVTKAPPVMTPKSPLPLNSETSKIKPIKKQEKARRTAPKLAEPPAKSKIAETPVTPKVASKPSSLGTDVETAMLNRAKGLLEARDLGAARMVFVYLARHGSAQAMSNLAQTYDPKYLVAHQFDEVKNGDIARAKRLYGAALGMGDTSVSDRLKELQ